MAVVVPLASLTAVHDDALKDLMAQTDRLDSLRDCVGGVIRAIHGLPVVLGCDLSQIQVYIGRAGRRAGLLRARWVRRHQEFDHAPSTHALVALRTSTATLRNERWERAAQLILSKLETRGALCCANAVIGDNGPWATTRESVLYLVARTRKGPVSRLDVSALNEAIGELIDEDDLDDDVVREAGRCIRRPEVGENHAVAELAETGEEQDDEDLPVCRFGDCEAAARPGNYGFCGRHRNVARSGEPACRVCYRRAKPGNYGFCGYHR